MVHPVLRMALVAVPIFLLDRLTKLWIVEWMDLKTVGFIEVFPPFLNFIMAWNQGINFGLGSSGADWVRWVWIGVAAAICIGLLVWSFRVVGWIVPISIGLVIGGAVGNVWDRVEYGAVADFLNMSCCGIQNPFSFNVADISIFIGAVGLIVFAGEKNGA